MIVFFFQAEDGIRDLTVTGVQTCALPIWIQARVTDPDSTPTQSDVLVAAASFVNPDFPTETSLVLFDDGSSAAFSILQKAGVPEDCTDDGFGVCTCDLKSYAVHSGDALASDAMFTRDLAFLDRSSLSQGLLDDCILQQYR